MSKKNIFLDTMESNVMSRVPNSYQTVFESHVTISATELCLKTNQLWNTLWPKFHLARLDSTRLDTFDFVEPVETSVSSETSRAVPIWRTTNEL